MSTTGTQTSTYTVVDIRGVVANFAADFSMMAQSTGLRSRDNVSNLVSDLKQFAEAAYLESVTVILKDQTGSKLRGAIYTVCHAANGWTCDRPGNSLWPSTPGGSLLVIAALTQDWWSKTDSQKKTFIESRGLHGSWDPSKEDTSLAGLTQTQGQRYASRGYGWDRANYA